MNLHFPPRKILVPMDLSEESFCAWLHARDLSKLFGAEFSSLYVQDWIPLEMEVGRPGLPEELRQRVIQEMRSRVGSAHKIRVSHGDAEHGILGAAARCRADLIVMGTHGRTGLVRILIGSVAEAVMHRTDIPVLVVRENPRPVKSILAPVNFTPYSDAALAYAAALAESLGVPLRPIHVEEGGKGGNPKFLFSYAWDRLCKERGAGKKPELLVRKGDPVSEILQAAAGGAWVVLAAHRKTLVKDFILGTTVERVLRHSPVPVLAVPDPWAAKPIGKRVATAMKRNPLRKPILI